MKTLENVICLCLLLAAMAVARIGLEKLSPSSWSIKPDPAKSLRMELNRNFNPDPSLQNLWSNGLYREGSLEDALKRNFGNPQLLPVSPLDR